MRASCGHEIPFDDREGARHDSPDASRIGMFPVAQHKSGMAEDALQKKWIAWDLMLRRERGIDRVERGFVRGGRIWGRGSNRHASLHRAAYPGPQGAPRGVWFLCGREGPPDSDLARWRVARG